MARIRRLPPPETADSFLWRICKALDEPPRMLAHNIGVPYHQLAPLLSDRFHLAEIDRDEVWWKVAAYVDERMGILMAIRHEMTRALNTDRSKRAARIAKQGRIMQKGSPRG